MENENFNHGVLKLHLNRFYGAGITEMVDDNGELHRGIFIPFDMNNISVDKYGDATATVFVNKRFNNPYGSQWDYFLKLYLDADTTARYRSIGLTTPRLGVYSETVPQMVDSRENFKVSRSIEQKL